MRDSSRVSPSGVRELEQPHGSPLRRDLRRLLRLTQIAWIYWTTGARVRRAYRHAQAAGTTLWLDEEPGLKPDADPQLGLNQEPSREPDDRAGDR